MKSNVNFSCRLIFWTNWNTHAPSIQRSFINGFAMQSIVTTNIKMPNAITLDFHTMKLYWGDARLDKIERCDTDGKNRVVCTIFYFILLSHIETALSVQCQKNTLVMA